MTSRIRRIRCGATGHRYEIDKAKVMGVTTALDLAVAKPALLRWAAKTTAEEALLVLNHPERSRWETKNGIGSDKDLVEFLAGAHVRQRNAAATRGTRVHKYAEKLVKGEEVEVPDELLGHVQACARFFDEWKIVPLLQEKTVGSYRWGYAGTFDLIAEIPDGRRILWDYKTGKYIYPEVRLQLAAYRYADAYIADHTGLEIPMTEVGITSAKVVHLRSDGYDVIGLDAGPQEHKVFLHALQVAKAAKAWADWQPVAERTPR